MILNEMMSSVGHRVLNSHGWKALVMVALCIPATYAQAQVVDIHGFISQGFIKSTGNNYLGETLDGEWEFTETGINFATELTDDLRVGAQLFARDLGPLGNMVIDSFVAGRRRRRAM